jgi:hypothetical protein
MITEEDYDFIQEVMEADGTEYGEFLQEIMRMYNYGNVSCGMSDSFKAALEEELRSNIECAREMFEIEHYEEKVCTTHKMVRLKEKE